MLDDLPESIPTLPSSAEEAYLQAKAGNELFGRELFAWSPSRIIAANSMGLVWPLPSEGVDQLRANGIYAGALRDTIIVTWLRSLRNSSEQDKEAVQRGDWNVQRATRAPREAFEVASAWAESHGMVALSDADGTAFAMAYKIALATLLGVSVSEFEVKPAEGATMDSKEGTTDPNG